MSRRPFRVLIPFNTGAFLYGMERAVIEMFDLARPDIQPLFVVSQNSSGQYFPVIDELKRRGMAIVPFSDRTDWPKFGKPKSLPRLFRMLRVFLLGNRDVFRHSGVCDAVYLPDAFYGFFAIATMVLYRLQGKRIYHQFHVFGARPQAQVRLINLFVTDHIHATPWGFDAVATLYPSLRSRRNHIVPIYAPTFDPPDPPEMTESFAGCRNIVFAGQLLLAKGVDLLLAAFDLIAARYPDVRLHLLGTGDCVDLMEEKSRSLPGRIKVWGYRGDVSAFFRNAFIAVQATPLSRYTETFGLTAVEAGLAGAPVVCFGSGALAFIVADGVTGTICSEETPESMATAIASYLDDPAMRDRQAAAAHRRMSDMFSREAIRMACLDAFGMKRTENS